MSAHRVDLDELGVVVASLARDLASLADLADVLDREANAHDGTWTGLAHSSYASSRASFGAGFAAMRSALDAMRSVAATAEDRYSSAAAHNVGLWRELA